MGITGDKQWLRWTRTLALVPERESAANGQIVAPAQSDGMQMEVICGHTAPATNMQMPAMRTQHKDKNSNIGIINSKW
jgi:hypothetical protein